MTLRRTAVVIAMVTGLCGVTGCGTDRKHATSPASASRLEVGFGTYGPLRVGMSRQQVLDATPVALTPYGMANPACTFLVDTQGAKENNPSGRLQVTLDRNDQVVGIDPPANARTDRGIAVGSTRAQVTTAYQEQAQEGESEGGHYMTFTGPNGSIGFSFDPAGMVVGIRAGTPDYSAGFELCSGG